MKRYLETEVVGNKIVSVYTESEDRLTNCPYSVDVIVSGNIVQSFHHKSSTVFGALRVAKILMTRR